MPLRAKAPRTAKSNKAGIINFPTATRKLLIYIYRCLPVRGGDTAEKTQKDGGIIKMASRKNHTLKLAGILLALVLVTSCFVGGTFAKYVTKGTGSDSARVAKFGVTVAANGSTFAEEYATDDGTVVGTIAKSVVSSQNKVKVVAPGTKGDMASMTLSGSPEVAVKVTYKATVNLGDKWVANGEYYCPLVITVNGDDINGLDYKTANDFATAVEAKINGYTKNYVANTNFGGDQAEEYKNDSLKVSWKWNFEATNFAKGNQTDEKDTILGNAAAEGNAATIDLEVVTTVTQID